MRPLSIGSAPLVKTMGIVAVAFFATCAAKLPPAVITVTFDDQIGGQGRQPIVMTLRPTVLDRQFCPSTKPAS